LYCMTYPASMTGMTKKGMPMAFRYSGYCSSKDLSTYIPSGSTCGNIVIKLAHFYYLTILKGSVTSFLLLVFL
jgi:hypothetical protein